MARTDSRSRHTKANHFLAGGDQYAASRPTYPPALVNALAACCQSTRHALDVGCGTGQLSLLLAERFDRVTAIDPSAAQIDNAVAHRSIQYRCEAAEVLSVENQSVDLIAAAQAAHWFNLDAFYDQVRRAAHAQTVLALVSYGVPVMAGPPGQRLDHFHWQDIHDFWPEGRQHVEQGYRSLEFPFAEMPLPKLAIEKDWSLTELLSYVRTWSAVKGAIAADHEAKIIAFEQELADLWGNPDRTRRITWPIAGRLGRVKL